MEKGVLRVTYSSAVLFSLRVDFFKPLFVLLNNSAPAGSSSGSCLGSWTALTARPPGGTGREAASVARAELRPERASVGSHWLSALWGHKESTATKTSSVQFSRSVASDSLGPHESHLAGTENSSVCVSPNLPIYPSLPFPIGNYTFIFFICDSMISVT